MRRTQPMGRRRVAAIIGLLLVATVSAAGLAATLVAAGSGTADPGATDRPVNADEAGRLALARLANYQDRQAAVRAAVGGIQVGGWVDWSRPVAYLNVDTGTEGGLVEAVPGLVAQLPGRYPGDGPPAVAPADGWRVRPAGTEPLDGLVALLFALAAPVADDPAAIVPEHTTVRPAQLDGLAVDVYTAPAPFPSTPASPAPPVTGAVQYWLDGTGRMRRVAATVGGDAVELDLARTTAQSLPALPVLGGAPVSPRPLTSQELTRVSRMRLTDRACGGGTVALALPLDGAQLVTGTGWLDWRHGVAYLGLHYPDDPTHDQWLRADATGASTRDGAATTAPPLRPPADGWHFAAWSARGDAGGASDLDILLTQAVSATGTRAASLADLRGRASFLRDDTLGGVPVIVVEIRQAGESAVAGSGRVRYWLDGTGLVRRIEVRTRQGGFGWLDVAPAPVPALPHPPTA